jgi:hypothetical protein
MAVTICREVVSSWDGVIEEIYIEEGAFVYRYLKSLKEIFAGFINIQLPLH